MIDLIFFMRTPNLYNTIFSSQEKWNVIFFNTKMGEHTNTRHRCSWLGKGRHLSIYMLLIITIAVMKLPRPKK